MVAGADGDQCANLNTPHIRIREILKLAQRLQGDFISDPCSWASFKSGGSLV